MNLFIDIETIPDQRPGALDLVRATIKPPATLKKAESIAAWWANEAEGATDDAYRKQSLDGGLHGEIISIAVMTDDGRQWVRCRAQGESEAHLLDELFFTVEVWTAEAVRAGEASAAWFPADDHFLIAHNAVFDIGFLWRRCIVNDVRIPQWLPPPSARAGKDFGCTMMKWAGFGGRVSLDALCRALNVPSPKEGGIDGSKVYDAWMAGQHDQIAAYNMADVVATAAVWQRMAGGRA